ARIVLVAPVGLKPETGEILDVFYYSPAQLLTMTVHDAKTVPEWQELYGRSPSPQEIEVATRNREMAARLTWKPYMHSPRLAHSLPCGTNSPLIIWGREARVVPVECSEKSRRGLPNAALTVLERCGHLPPIEQPDVFARLVLDFLGGDSRR